jgi:hypothetical protein
MPLTMQGNDVFFALKWFNNYEMTANGFLLKIGIS